MFLWVKACDLAAVVFSRKKRNDDGQAIGLIPIDTFNYDDERPLFIHGKDLARSRHCFRVERRGNGRLQYSHK